MLNPLMPSRIFYLIIWAVPFSVQRVSGLLFLLLLLVENSAFNANSADPDQTPHSVASDLGLHCLPMSPLWDAIHKLVK